MRHILRYPCAKSMVSYITNCPLPTSTFIGSDHTALRTFANVALLIADGTPEESGTGGTSAGTKVESIGCGQMAHLTAHVRLMGTLFGGASRGSALAGRLQWDCRRSSSKWEGKADKWHPPSTLTLSESWQFRHFACLPGMCQTPQVAAARCR